MYPIYLPLVVLAIALALMLLGHGIDRHLDNSHRSILTLTNSYKGALWAVLFLIEIVVALAVSSIGLVLFVIALGLSVYIGIQPIFTDAPSLFLAGGGIIFLARGIQKYIAPKLALWDVEPIKKPKSRLQKMGLEIYMTTVTTYYILGVMVFLYGLWIME